MDSIKKNWMKFVEDMSNHMQEMTGLGESSTLPMAIGTIAVATWIVLSTVSGWFFGSSFKSTESSP